MGLKGILNSDLAVISLDENMIMSYSIDRFLGVGPGPFILHLQS